jgi:hypothetical protein
LLGGIAHLARLIDKIRLRHAGLIQDYNYLTAGFDKHLMDFLRIDPQEFEKQILRGASDEDLLAWVTAHGRSLSLEDTTKWTESLLTSGPKDDSARQRFQTRLADVAAKRGVSVESLPKATTWVDVIELDEERM